MDMRWRQMGIGLVCILVFGRGPSATAAPLHAEMAAHLKTEGLTGVVWSQVTPGGVQTGAAGLKNARTAAALTPDARVHVGSVTKAVLAVGILRLITTGQLALDTDVAALLPALHFENPWYRTDPIRVRHLLEHTAGLENFRLSQAFSLRPRPDTPLSAALDRSPSPLVVRSRPGARFAYSNAGYLLLGMIIEAVTKERYESYLDRELLKPLGMLDSTFAFTVQSGAGADHRLAMGHFENGVPHPAVPTFIRPAAQFTTSAVDMGRFAQFLMGSGELGGRAFIARELMAALSGGRGTDAALAGLDVGHGLVLTTRDRHQVVGHCHPGNTVGFRAMLCIYPEHGKAFFVAANADVENADYERLSKSMIKSLDFPAPVAAPAAAAPPPRISEWEGMYVPAWNAVASFAWIDTLFNAVRVRWDGDYLHLDPVQGKDARLMPAGGALFRATDRIQPSHVLLVAENREQMLSDGLRNYRKVPLLQMLGLWTSAALGMAGLFHVMLKGSWLLARRRLDTKHPLVIPTAAVLMLAVPVPFFFAQSFLELGDLTIASALLALSTFLLPFGMAFGLLRLLRQRAEPVRGSALDGAALLAVTQWMIVLAAWGMIPVVLWQ